MKSSKYWQRVRRLLSIWRVPQSNSSKLIKKYHRLSNQMSHKGISILIREVSAIQAQGVSIKFKGE